MPGELKLGEGDPRTEDDDTLGELKLVVNDPPL
jgi:hypothetical protein